MSCKKGVFITLRHNEIRDVTAELLSRACKDVIVEPSLRNLNGEEKNMRRTVKETIITKLD